MSWFVAKIVFRIQPASPAALAQFDEQLHLICAETADQAFFKARLLGIQEEDSGTGDTRKRVLWEFVNISELFPLNELVDGTEVYSRIYETSEAAAYINLVHRKAADLAA